ncbi:MAG TPA: hypothetical protein VFE63_14515 [Roseiarcus sp.]|nr:hypothetical protein [Roseiarcus sp.]
MTAPRPLTAEEVQSCRKVFAKALGRPLDFVVAVDPGLIAVNAAIFDEAEAIGVGSLVSARGDVARAPVGPGLPGRVIDPLGRPLDRDEPVAAEAFHPMERPAHSLGASVLVGDRGDARHRGGPRQRAGRGGASRNRRRRHRPGAGARRRRRRGARLARPARRPPRHCA